MSPVIAENSSFGETSSFGECNSFAYSTEARQVSESRLVTPQGGEVIVDQLLLEIWQNARGRSLAELCTAYPAGVIRRLGHDPTASDLDLLLSLACLSEAGLLSRSLPEGTLPSYDQRAASHPLPTARRLVSIVIVSYNSQEWLPACLDSLQNQSYRPLEVIVVDNGSTDGSGDWLKHQVTAARTNPDERSPITVERTLSVEPTLSVKRTLSVRAICLDSAVSLAAAINLGVRQARGDFYFILNPDTRLDAQSVAALVEALEEPGRPPTAAAAARLKLMWTPGFLNGLGNYVGAISWGIDIGLGHLDLGQFDRWRYLPSACFAAAMIPASAWKAVGPLDENLPMYYEDSEWCYRARLLGWQIAAVPQSVVYHALGGRNPAKQDHNPAKQQRVVYGRLHFCTRLLGMASWLRFMAGYLAEDFTRWTLAVLRRQADLRHSICEAWRRYLKAYPRLRQENRSLRKSRSISDRQLLRRQVTADQPLAIPPPLVRQGIPLLTWEIVRSIYSPYLVSADHPTGQALPEIAWARSHFDPEQLQRRKPGLLGRARMIYHLEGGGALLERIAKTVQHALR